MVAGRWILALTLSVALVLTGAQSAQTKFFDDLSGMEAPEDVTGADCTMCHGSAAQNAKFPHPPAKENQCTTCHSPTGVGGHGALVDNERTLCLACHKDYEKHYAPMTCWTSSCHNDVHGSNVDEYLNPSRQEDYPGFRQATYGAKHVGSKTCLACHTEYCEGWSESAHSLTDIGGSAKDEKGCESCHGPGGNHWGRRAGIGIFDYASTSEVNSTCLRCHEADIYVPDYKGNEHSRADVSCISCHNPHQQDHLHNLRSDPNALCLTCHDNKRIDFARFSHHPVDMENPRTGMLCVDCHNPHGGEGHFMLDEPQDQMCFKCHADKEGPFVFAHAGYEYGLGQGCATCHEAHGSNAPNLLKLSGRGVCLQCHTDRVTHFPDQPTCWTSGCHSSHHGSNKNYFFFEP